MFRVVLIQFQDCENEIETLNNSESLVITMQTTTEVKKKEIKSILCISLLKHSIMNVNAYGQNHFSFNICLFDETRWVRALRDLYIYFYFEILKSIFFFATDE